MSAFDPKRTLASSILNYNQTQSKFVMTYFYSYGQQVPKPIKQIPRE